MIFYSKDIEDAGFCERLSGWFRKKSSSHGRGHASSSSNLCKDTKEWSAIKTCDLRAESGGVRRLVARCWGTTTGTLGVLVQIGNGTDSREVGVHRGDIGWGSARTSTVGLDWFNVRQVSNFCSIVASLNHLFLGNSCLTSANNNFIGLGDSFIVDGDKLHVDHWGVVSAVEVILDGDLDLSSFFVWLLAGFFFFGGVHCILFSTSSALVMQFFSICLTGCWSFFSFLYLKQCFYKLCLIKDVTFYIIILRNKL